MKKSRISLNSVAATIGYGVVLYYLGSCTYAYMDREYRVDPGEAVRIGVTGVVAEAYSPRSMHGDGTSMAVWNTYSSAEDLLQIVDRSHIELGRIWFEGPFDEQGKQGLEWLARDPLYAKMTPHVERILEGQYFYSYDTYRGDVEYVQNCGMWLVSPEQRLIAFLDRDF